MTLLLETDADAERMIPGYHPLRIRIHGIHGTRAPGWIGPRSLFFAIHPDSSGVDETIFNI